MNPTNGKRRPPLNLRTDLNSIIKTGIVAGDACSVYDVQNTKKHSIQLPDEQKSNNVERTVDIKKLKGGKPLLLDSNKTLNMSMTAISVTSMTSILKSCVKTTIFRKCKFYYRNLHWHYTTKANTMCGQIIKHCNITNPTQDWWYQIGPIVVNTVTDHVNNCIKAMQKRFSGTWVCAKCSLRACSFNRYNVVTR